MFKIWYFKKTLTALVLVLEIDKLQFVLFSDNDVSLNEEYFMLLTICTLSINFLITHYWIISKIATSFFQLRPWGTHFCHSRLPWFIYWSRDLHVMLSTKIMTSFFVRKALLTLRWRIPGGSEVLLACLGRIPKFWYNFKGCLNLLGTNLKIKIMNYLNLILVFLKNFI